jgi:hypothetical protein
MVSGLETHGWGMRRIGRSAMRRFWLGALVAGLLIAILAETRAQQAPGEDATVRAGDGELADAIRAGDKSAARRLLSLQFTFVDENGKLLERKDFLDVLKSAAGGPPTDEKVTVYGGIAMVTGKRKSAQDGEVFFIDVWAKQKRAWRALTMQEVALAASAPLPDEPEARPYDCKNPCQAIPYRVRSPAEQDVINAFQAIEKANIAHDTGEWSKRVADEFVLYRSGRPAKPKSARAAAIDREKKEKIAVTVDEIESMRLSVYGDGAAMLANEVAPDDSRAPFRVARVWVRRNGQWQLAISVQTDIRKP